MQKLCMFIVAIMPVLTHACDPISSVSLVTGTGEATRSVGTGSIGVAVISNRSTLVNIYIMKTIIYLESTTITYPCMRLRLQCIPGYRYR